MSATAHTAAWPKLTVLFLVLVFGLPLAGPRAAAQDSPVPVYELFGAVSDVDGNDLEGASVLLFKKSDGAQQASASTDAEGQYKFTQLPAGTWIVMATHDCCLKSSVEATTGGLAVQHSAPPIELKPKEPVTSDDPVLLSGLVTDQATGSPLAGVNLDIYSYYGEEDTCDADVCAIGQGVQYLFVQTDAQGGFELEVNRGSATLRAWMDGYDATSGSFPMSDDRSLEVPMRATDDNTARLWGVVRDLEGQAVPDAYVWAGPDYDYGCPPYADCLYAPAYAEQASCEDPPCWLFESSQSQYNSTQADAEGRWEMRVAAGTIRVQASAEEYIEDVAQLATEPGGDVEVPLALEKIPPDSVTVTGRVTDASTGEPVTYAHVSIENQQWGTWAGDYTDEDGRYDLAAKPGYNILTVNSYGGGCVLAYAEDSEGDAPASSIAPAPCRTVEDPKQYYTFARSFSAGEGDGLEFDVELKGRPAPTSVFLGYVLNASSGEAVPEAVVTFYNELTHDWGSATTDGNGSYRIAVHAGYYSIRTWHADHFDGVAILEIGEGEEQRADFELTPGHKRYGYWAYGGYAVMEQSADASPAGAGPEGPPEPTQGDESYEGSAGGLGPYKPAGRNDGGKAPSPGLLLVGLGIAGAVLARRRLI